jgi:hypothetical protein
MIQPEEILEKAVRPYPSNEKSFADSSGAQRIRGFDSF